MRHLYVTAPKRNQIVLKSPFSVILIFEYQTKLFVPSVSFHPKYKIRILYGFLCHCCLSNNIFIFVCLFSSN